MPFSIGFLELLAIVLVAVPTLVLYARRDTRCRWLFAMFVCAILAASMTPADLLSMLLFLLAFLVIFAMGVTYCVRHAPTAE